MPGTCGQCRSAAGVAAREVSKFAWDPALDARDRWKLSYYDAQIWAAAALAGVPVVLSEDFADGLVLGPVRFVDPFADDFDLEAALA